MELLLEGTLKQIKDQASKGLLTWKGRKVLFDPFLPLDLLIEIEAKEPSQFSLAPLMTVGSREEPVDQWEPLAPLGALQGGVFRLWKDPNMFRWVRKIQALPSLISAKELDTLLQEDFPFRWKGEKPRLKPAPLPILKLVDRTGGFANLLLDYGAWGIVDFHSREQPDEEKYWENDLLTTGFKKKIVGASHYFCALDQVGQTLSFLLDVGWKVIDYQGKEVVRQHQIDCSVKEQENVLLLRGTLQFGQHSASIQDVMGAFERHERWIDLSPHQVGLIELPPAWEALIEEERSPEGLRVRQTQIGLLSQLDLLPPEYRFAQWQETLPSPAFQGTLFPYQQKGVDWLSFLYRTGCSGLLADEMGLGKTVQMLAFLTLREGPVLIVMPVTLLSLWKQQIEHFLPGTSVYIHQGPGRAQSLSGNTQIILTSYSMLRSDLHLFTEIAFDTVILDEAQMIKNSTTQVAQSVYQLKSRFRLALTGTPLENRVEEIVSIFRFLLPTLFKEKVSALDTLTRKKMNPFILRRTKKEVGLDLPEKIVQTIGVDPSDEEYALYETLLQTRKTRLLQQIAEEGGAAHRMEILELILRLRQHCCHPQLLDPSYTGECRKFERVLSDLEEVISSGHKVLLYSQFTSMLKLFRQACQNRGWKWVYLDGTTQDRNEPTQQFQNDPTVSIFLISLKAGGVGLNLQAADYVFLYDPWWNTAVEHQAIDRAHRIGRKETVIARKYFTTQSIEAKILDLQSKKEALTEELWSEQGLIEMLPLEYDEILGFFV